jgi:hypothetical protein
MLNVNVLSEKEEEDKREKKMSLAGTRIISTSINQVDFLSSYESILSIFLNMQVQEVTSSQKSLTRYRHMRRYS